jgi:hypothetical protein
MGLDVAGTCFLALLRLIDVGCVERTIELRTKTEKAIDKIKTEIRGQTIVFLCRRVKRKEIMTINKA